MSDSRVKSAAKQIGMVGVLTIVVTVLTLFFNLCGTLSASVISGMMTGASRRWKWQAIPVSLVPPIVVLTLTPVTKVGLDLPQRISIAGVCLGAFWGTYLVTFLLMCLEKKSSAGQAASRPSPVRRESGVLTQVEVPPLNTCAAGAAAKIDTLPDEFELEHLQGTWLCEANSPKGPSHKKVFAVVKDKFSLSVVNSSGRPHLVAQGDVIVENGNSPRRLVLAAIAAGVKQDGLPHPENQPTNE